MIHLIQVDRDGIMSFACDEVELFTTQGATRDVFKILQSMNTLGTIAVQICPYCIRLLTQRNFKNSGVQR